MLVLVKLNIIQVRKYALSQINGTIKVAEKYTFLEDVILCSKARKVSQTEVCQCFHLLKRWKSVLM